MTLGAGAAKQLAERIGGLVQEADAERRYQTRTRRWSSTSSPSIARPAPIGRDDVRALVAEALPGRVWAFSDAVGERKRGVRPSTSSTGCSTPTPEPVLLAVLHRRLRELLELGDRLAAGETLPALGRAMGDQQRIPGTASCAAQARYGRPRS